MNLRQLEQFVAIADAGGFRRGAEALGMAQPPLSVAIRKLEKTLGGQLFDRGRQGVVLTPLGLAILDDARQAAVHVERVRASARGARAGIAGTLRVGFIGSATYSLFPRALPRFRKQYPLVDLDMRERTTTQILREVEAGALDVGLVRYPVFEQTSARLDPVEADELVVALPNGHARSRRRKIELASLADEPFILYSAVAAANLRGVVVAACQTAGFSPRVVQEAVQVQTIMSLVESGLGVALVPSICKGHASTRVALRPLAVAIPVAIALASRQGSTNDLPSRFRDVLIASPRFR